MAQGIQLPLIAKNGRLKLLEGDAYIAQLISVALGDNESQNPFQDIGLGEFMIFGMNDSYTEAEIREKVREVFESLETDQLAKLETDDKAISFERDVAAGTLSMFVSYVNLETQEQQELEVPIPSAT